jgi:Ca2+-binding EF-hand superfamily protein
LPAPKSPIRHAVDVADFRDAFPLINGGDTISTRGLTTFMNSLGMHPTEAEAFEIMAQLDTDWSGTIDFDEIMALIVLNNIRLLG